MNFFKIAGEEVKLNERRVGFGFEIIRTKKKVDCKAVVFCVSVKLSNPFSLLELALAQIGLLSRCKSDVDCNCLEKKN